MTVYIEVKEDDLLWQYPREMLAKDLEKPLTYFTIVVTGEQSMGKVTSVLRQTKSASRGGDISKNFVKSFLGWKNVMHHSPNEGVVAGL